MRRAIVVAAALLLSGCETQEEFWRPFRHFVEEFSPREMRSAQRAQTTDSIDQHCRDVATERSMDARANRYSIEMEHIIYEGTYKDCVDWDTQHRH